jgi:Zn-dependent protease with chaperone function
MRIRLALLTLILFSMTVYAQRTRLRPGTNIFSPQQDIEMGQEVAKEAEQQLSLIRNADANAYIAALGAQVLSRAPNDNDFPFTFKIVDERSINAFALPGGPIYVHRGAIEAADNEAQLAGVIGHEIGHVLLRHGTNQVTRAQIAQAPLAVLGGVLGGSNMGQIINQIGGFAAGSILLRYSRDAETQSDLMGTQLLYDLNYDPRAMAQFFDKLAREHKGSKAEQFFSNHPIPENRIISVNDEIRKLGGLPASPRLDSPDFQDVKKIMLSLPEPKPAAKPADNTGRAPTAPALPSSRMVAFESGGVRLQHPDNWISSVQGTNITLAPEGGSDGQGSVAYGLIVDVFQPQGARNISEATAQFLEGLRKTNPAMKTVRSGVQTRIDGQAALLSEVSNESPAGGPETDVIITVRRPDSSLLYFIQVAPSKDFPRYQAPFRNIMNSVRLPR